MDSIQAKKAACVSTLSSEFVQFISEISEAQKPSMILRLTRLSSEHAGWAEGSCVTSRRIHEAVLRVIISPPAGAPALCRRGPSPRSWPSLARTIFTRTSCAISSTHPRERPPRHVHQAHVLTPLSGQAAAADKRSRRGSRPGNRSVIIVRRTRLVGKRRCKVSYASTKLGRTSVFFKGQQIYSDSN